jgi:hypothetical protein
MHRRLTVAATARSAVDSQLLRVGYNWVAMAFLSQDTIPRLDVLATRMARSMALPFTAIWGRVMKCKKSYN